MIWQAAKSKGGLPHGTENRSNYQLAQADEKTDIFENWCDFLNYFDASVQVQLSFINQGGCVELPPLCRFLCRFIWKKELVYRYIVTGNKLIKNLQTWLLPLIFNIGKVTRRNIYCVAYIFAAFFSFCSSCFYRLPESCEVIKWYRSFCHVFFTLLHCIVLISF